MQSANVTQLVRDGLAPFSWASECLVYKMLDIKDTTQSSHNNVSRSNFLLIFDVGKFRRVLNDLKITHKTTFVYEINRYDQHRKTLLWYLTVSGAYDVIKEFYRLTSNQLNVNSKNGLFGQTVLHYAVIHGNVDEIQLLLNIGVDVNICDQSGRNVLHYIATYDTEYKNNIEIAQLLINHGVSPK